MEFEASVDWESRNVNVSAHPDGRIFRRYVPQ
jgi:hypothetical protein